MLRYIRRDPRLIAGYVGFFVLLTVELVLVFAPISPISLGVAALGVITSFILTGWLWVWTTRLLNPADHILPAIQRRAIRDLDRAFDKLKRLKLNLSEQAEIVEEMMRQTLMTSEKLDPKRLNSFQVPREAMKDVVRELRVLKDLALGFIRTGQTEMLSLSENSAVSIVGHYFQLRKDYLSSSDQFLFDLSDDLRDLSTAAAQAPNIHMPRIIWRTIEQIGIAALGIKVAGCKEGYHQLVMPLTGLLRDGALRDGVLMKTDSTFEAIRSLGVIGGNLARRGLSKTAAEICYDISSFAVLGMKTAQSPIAIIAKQHMAEIFHLSLDNRMLFTNYHYPFNRMVDAYKRALGAGHQITIGIDDPIAWYEPDQRTDRSVSGLVRIALFPKNDADDVVFYNIDVVESLISLLQEYIVKDQSLQTSFVSQLYQVALWLIGYIEPKFGVDLLVYRRSAAIPSARNRKKATRLLFDLTAWMYENLTQSLISGGNRIVDSTELLDILLSIYCIVLFVDRMTRRLGLGALLGKVLRMQLSDARSKIKSIRLDDVDWTNLWIFSHVLLRERRFSKIGKRLSRYLRLARMRAVGSHEFNLLDHIKRPITTFDQTLFTRIDTEILDLNRPRRARGN